MRVRLLGASLTPRHSPVVRPRAKRAGAWIVHLVQVERTSAVGTTLARPISSAGIHLA